MIETVSFLLQSDCDCQSASSALVSASFGLVCFGLVSTMEKPVICGMIVLSKAEYSSFFDTQEDRGQWGDKPF